jgi:hypothetical protein
MLTLQIPMLLALLGTALMAVVIFAPSRLPRPVTISLAPPYGSSELTRWEPAPAAHWDAPPAREPWEPPAPGDDWEISAAEPPPSDAPLWPTLVDRRACDCDATARLGLVEALATVRSSWSETILRRALDDEPDPAVRDAVVRALGA